MTLRALWWERSEVPKESPKCVRTDDALSGLQYIL